jgi:hypothetical protein
MITYGITPQKITNLNSLLFVPRMVCDCVCVYVNKNERGTWNEFLQYIKDISLQWKKWYILHFFSALITIIHSYFKIWLIKFTMLLALCQQSWKFSSSIRHIHIMIFWDAMSYNLASRNQHFEGNYTFHHLLWRWRKQVPPKSCYLATNLHSATSRSLQSWYSLLHEPHISKGMCCVMERIMNIQNWITNESSVHPTDLPLVWFCLCVGLVLTEETWIVSFEWVFTDLRVICSRFIPWNLT